MMVNLCDLISDITLASKDKGGVMVFMQSYAFKNTFLVAFKNSQGYKAIRERDIKVFNESKENLEVFNDYTKEVQVNKKKALLFCVIGGKLSEGINFSDDLARTVIVCGLPFANNQSTDIKQKMLYFDSQKLTDFSGNEYYENLCMKTLN